MKIDDNQRALLDIIERAFGGVVLGTGVSLHETQIIDDYGTEEERLLAQEPDEKLDWRKLIDDPELVRCCSVAYAGLCFFDAEGMRFHLPACLSRAVVDRTDSHTVDMVESLFYALTNLDKYRLQQHSLLNGTQRKCVSTVMRYLRTVWEFEDMPFDRAIETFWGREEL